MTEIPRLENQQAIHINYVPKSHLQEAISNLQAVDLKVLFVEEHATKLSAWSTQDQAVIHQLSGLKSLNEDSWCELWCARGNWLPGQHVIDSKAVIEYLTGPDYVIGSVLVELAENQGLETLSQQYYEQILSFISEQKMPHLLRMWNYFPQINVIDHELERYQQFCVGRHTAFDHYTKDDQEQPQYPAASAVGNQSKLFQISFIASSSPGLFLENPGQVSSYLYPSQYSPKSPSFARATVFVGQLYISGTASIVGHESCYQDDIVGQTQQTLKNIEQLILHADRETQSQYDFFKMAVETHNTTAIKVFLRHPEHQDTVASLITRAFPKNNNICYLQADICRQELDIEVEMLITA